MSGHGRPSRTGFPPERQTRSLIDGDLADPEFVGRDVRPGVGDGRLQHLAEQACAAIGHEAQRLERVLGVPSADERRHVTHLACRYRGETMTRPEVHRADSLPFIAGQPCDSNDPNHIRDVNGYDFVIFENGFISGFTNPMYGFVTGEVFAELGYVEVSSNGSDFVRFAPVSLTGGGVGVLGTVDITDVFNFAGKHPNGYGKCTGTAFDLHEIKDEQMVKDGVVDINNISYVRIIDVPGSGDFNDAAVEHIDPNTWPGWDYYAGNHSIYDAWQTMDSGGLDLEAIGVLCEQRFSADINLDGVVDFYDFVVFAYTWRGHFGGANWVMRCDLAEPKDLVIDMADLAEFCGQWLGKETWRD